MYSVFRCAWQWKPGRQRFCRYVLVHMCARASVGRVPSDLGNLSDSPDELPDRFHLERIPSPSGVPHHIFWHR